MWVVTSQIVYIYHFAFPLWLTLLIMYLKNASVHCEWMCNETMFIFALWLMKIPTSAMNATHNVCIGQITFASIYFASWHGRISAKMKQRHTFHPIQSNAMQCNETMTWSIFKLALYVTYLQCNTSILSQNWIELNSAFCTQCYDIRASNLHFGSVMCSCWCMFDGHTSTNIPIIILMQ